MREALSQGGDSEGSQVFEGDAQSESKEQVGLWGGLAVEGRLPHVLLYHGESLYRLQNNNTSLFISRRFCSL